MISYNPYLKSYKGYARFAHTASGGSFLKGKDQLRYALRISPSAIS